MNKKYAGLDFPVWFDGKDVNEAAFCREFLSKNKLIYADNAFFTPDGRLTDPLLMKEKIYAELECCAARNIPRTISNIVEIMKLAAHTGSFPPKPDEIHVQNGTLRTDGSFLAGRPEIVRSRFSIAYNPQAGKPVVWLRFLSDLLYPEDIPTFQEYIGYCLVPSTKGQRMMILKGEGGEGKSQIGPVLVRLFGCNMKDGSIAKISDNRFARADLEHIQLLVDDDMKMEALKQTNYVKSIVTAQGKMDLERKSVQSYQGWMYARLLAFSNGDLQSLYDRSNGFYRRQLILTTKEKPAGRVDDPDIAEKMKLEIEGIFLWAFEGLQRLAANNFRFTESLRTLNNREYVKRDANNAIDFMESTGYIRLKADMSVTSKELYAIYGIWCDENGLTPIRQRSFSDFLMRNLKTYNLEHMSASKAGLETIAAKAADSMDAEVEKFRALQEQAKTVDVAELHAARMELRGEMTAAVREKIKDTFDKSYDYDRFRQADRDVCELLGEPHPDAQRSVLHKLHRVQEQPAAEKQYHTHKNEMEL